jgi:hypothetical protein
MSGINSMLAKAISLMAPDQLRSTIASGQADFNAFLSHWARNRARRQYPVGDIPPQLILVLPHPDHGIIYERVEVVADGPIYRLNRYESIDLATASAAYVELMKQNKNE